FVTVSGPYAYVLNRFSNTMQIFAGGTGVGFGAPLAASALTGVNGAGLTNLSAASISGTIANKSLPSNIARLDGNQTFTGQMTFSNTTNFFSGAFSGNGGNAEAGIVYNNFNTRGGLQLRTGGNQTRMSIDSAGTVNVPGTLNTGTVTAGNVNYTAPRLTYRMFSVSAFVPGITFEVDAPVRIGFYRNVMYGPNGSRITLHVPLDLPHNARIRQIEVYCNDLDSTRFMRFYLLGTDLPAQTASVLAEATTENLSGSQLTVSLPIPTPIVVNNTNRSLEFYVQPERPVPLGAVIEWSNNLQLAGLRIAYETDGPAQ
ncbi:MAG: hypothetical protein K2X32_04410, partial [Phycisphaerales bacterium]|nr:hypothetical protein [Phycisphaerales bacterium]